MPTWPARSAGVQLVEPFPTEKIVDDNKFKVSSSNFGQTHDKSGQNIQRAVGARLYLSYFRGYIGDHTSQ